MRKFIEQVTLPLVVMELPKSEADGRTIDDIIEHLRARISAHHCARFIGVFDHYAHTRGLPDGEIAPDIVDARNVVFCFGMAIPHPTSLATRPRSVGICELADRFVLSFLQAPMPIANAAIEGWLMEFAERSTAPAVS